MGSAPRLGPKEGSTVRTRGRACLFVLLLAAGAASADTFTVTSTADTDDGTCDADCTLREAINAANANTGADIIDFSVPAGSTITLGTSLANIDGDLDIDGTTATSLEVSDSGGFPIFQVDTGTTVVRGVSITGLEGLVPGGEVTAVLHHDDGSEDSVTLRHTLNAEQIEWFKAGSSLNVLKQG